MRPIWLKIDTLGPCVPTLEKKMAASKNFSLKQFFLLKTFSDFKQLIRFAQDFTYLAYSFVESERCVQYG